MANPAPVCTHVKTDGVRCGSPAVSGSEVCYHHSAVKMALGKAPSRKGQHGAFEPIPFVFPEDRASMQINYFLLLQAFNEGRVDLKHFKAMMSMLKSMAANLGKSGSLVEEDRALGLTPWLSQPLKTLIAVRCKLLDRQDHCTAF